MPDRPFEGSTSAQRDSRMACERCVWGSGEHAEWCPQRDGYFVFENGAMLAMSGGERWQSQPFDVEGRLGDQ